MCNAYLQYLILTSALRDNVTFAKTKTMVISREDRILTKVLHQEKGYGSKK